VFADEIRRAVEASTRKALPQVTALLWQAFAEGRVTETEAEKLSALIEEHSRAPGPRDMASAQDAVPLATTGPARRWGSRPRTDASMERRRRWAASGRLPPALACRFTLAEQAVLALVAAETTRRGDCRMAVGHIAAVAGVSETTVRNAIREARKLGLVTVEERRVTGFRNETNVVRIVSPEWQAWMRLARRETRIPVEGGGCKSPQGTPTSSQNLANRSASEPSKSCRRTANPTRRRAQPDSGRSRRMA
jgi:hypothetical protein